MFYDNYCELCRARGLTPSGAAERIGFNRASVTVWKKNGKAPGHEILLKISRFFGVSPEVLLSKEPSGEDLDHQLEGVEFALFGEVRDMTDAQKRDVLTFARFIKQQGKEV